MSSNGIYESSKNLSWDLPWFKSPCMKNIPVELLEMVLKHVPKEEFPKLRLINHRWNQHILSTVNILRETSTLNHLSSIFQTVHKQITQTQNHLRQLHRRNKGLEQIIVEKQIEVNANSLCYRVLNVLLQKISSDISRREFKSEVEVLEKKFDEIDRHLNSEDLKKLTTADLTTFFVKIEDVISKVLESLKSSQDFQDCFVKVLCQLLTNFNKTTKAVEIYHKYGCKNKSKFSCFLLINEFKQNLDFSKIFESLKNISDKQRMNILLDFIFLALQKNDTKLVNTLKLKWKEEETMLVKKLCLLEESAGSFQSEIDEIRKILDRRGIIQEKFNSINAFEYDDLDGFDLNEDLIKCVEEDKGFIVAVLVSFNYYISRQCYQKAKGVYQKLLQTIKEKTNRSYKTCSKIDRCKNKIIKTKNKVKFNRSKRLNKRSKKEANRLFVKEWNLISREKNIREELGILNGIKRQMERINSEIVLNKN